jgi:hypothetical protein
MTHKQSLQDSQDEKRLWKQVPDYEPDRGMSVVRWGYKTNRVITQIRPSLKVIQRVLIAVMPPGHDAPIRTLLHEPASMARPERWPVGARWPPDFDDPRTPPDVVVAMYLHSLNSGNEEIRLLALVIKPDRQHADKSTMQYHYRIQTCQILLDYMRKVVGQTVFLPRDLESCYKTSYKETIQQEVTNIIVKLIQVKSTPDHEYIPTTQDYREAALEAERECDHIKLLMKDYNLVKNKEQNENPLKYYHPVVANVLSKYTRSETPATVSTSASSSSTVSSEVKDILGLLTTLVTGQTAGKQGAIGIKQQQLSRTAQITMADTALGASATPSGTNTRGA